MGVSAAGAIPLTSAGGEVPRPTVAVFRPDLRHRAVISVGRKCVSIFSALLSGSTVAAIPGSAELPTPRSTTRRCGVNGRSD
jgi:hypothetical protein